MQLNFVLFIVFPIISGKLILLNSNTNETIGIRALNGLPWALPKHLLDDEKYKRETDGQINNSTSMGASQRDRYTYSIKELISLPLVPLYIPIGDYNPCDESTFQMNILKPLQERLYGQSTEEHDWMALVLENPLRPRCNDNEPFHFKYETYIVLNAQKLGASGVIGGSGFPEIKKVTVPPDVDVVSRKVHNEEIKIPYFVINENLGEKYLLNPDKSEWRIISGEVDQNEFDGIYTQWGLYHILWLIIGSYSLLMSIFIALHLKKVLMYFKEKKSLYVSSVALQMRLLILIPQFVSGIIRALVSIDPAGVFYTFNVIIARSLLSLSATLSTFIDVVMVIYALDVYNTFNASRNMQKNVAIFDRYKNGFTAVLVFASAMILADQVLNVLTLRGVWGTSVLPAIYQLIMSASVATVLYAALNVIDLDSAASHRHKKGGKRSPSVELKIAAVEGEQALGKNNVVATDAIRRMLRFRIYLLVIVLGRFFTVCVLILYSFGVHQISPIIFGSLAIILPLSATVSSTAQVLAALQLPSKIESARK